jgi:YVTN family beta-propeller protein
MKHIFTIFLILVCAFVAKSEFHYGTNKNFTVGNQPMAVSVDKSVRAHVLCIGTDFNYNGQKDEGDEAPSWWVSEPINGNLASLTNFHKVKDFSFGALGGFPVRPCFDYENSILYITENYAVATYNLNTYELIDSAVAPINASAISIDGDYLYLSVTPYSNEGMVIKYNYKTKTPIDTLTKLMYPRQTLPYWNGSLAVLEENNFASNLSKIYLYDVSGSQFLKFAEISVGDVANHMAIKGNNLYVTMNGSNEIKIIDLNTRTVIDSIKLSTSGYNGPRESAIAGDNDDFKKNTIFTTSYNGYIYEINNGKVTDSVMSHGKTESISIPEYSNFPVMIVTNCNQSSNYSADTVVTLYMNVNNINDNQKFNKANIYPNPAIDNFNINLYADNGSSANIQITNSNGENVYYTSKLINDGKIQFNLSEMNLAVGAYIINTTVANKVYTSKLIVSK